MWDERYDQEDYLFGKAPNAFLARQAHRLAPGMRALAVADGEGRNGVWLAEQGAHVVAVDASPVGVAKARKLAAERGVSLEHIVADMTAWDWPDATFDLVVAIFIQVTTPDERAGIFKGMIRALKPGGLLLLEGYGTGQLAYGTGGPKDIERLYTEDLLRTSFAELEILELSTYDAELDEGARHRGMSALVDLVARKAA